ncbi:MAG: LexA family transcriptional regulator [Nitrospinaceae bacterium]|mgnify:FL=1|jgi:transcriptional regulator with XRE-family HTH domain|nr:LexA family transcriptional regulator [Nitrospinaceae bacterium]MBT3435288.1 LexA family transcriptional regulator [Nitrospinaceae bacterium]MBT3821344.1 LexA family transcriptional regulator [Nitrospinaceae bacterium]MBT4095079.1 LexA family transcriptional regulator [Nitrospinaceae bacterium]MBT4432452.1 LexA family transcriptional regulator [Nitrospinaceae bacterium]
MAKSAHFKIAGSRIVRARSQRGWNRNQLARISGISWANLARYEEGENEPSAGKLLCIAEALGVSVDWILGREGAKESVVAGPVDVTIRMSSNIQGSGIVDESEFRAVPLVSGTIAAGSARIVDENIDEYALIHISQITGRSDLVAVRVDLEMGRSMLPLIQPGAVVVIDRQDNLIIPDGMYAVRDHSGGCTLKRLQWTAPRLWLVPENRDEPVAHIDLDVEGPEKYIVGRVVWAYQPLV